MVLCEGGDEFYFLFFRFIWFQKFSWGKRMESNLVFGRNGFGVNGFDE